MAKRYGMKQRAVIVEVAKLARGAGQTWAQAHEAAKKAGYKGSAAGLYQMLRPEAIRRPKPKATPNGLLDLRDADLRAIVEIVNREVGAGVAAERERLAGELEAIVARLRARR